MQKSRYGSYRVFHNWFFARLGFAPNADPVGEYRGAWWSAGNIGKKCYRIDTDSVTVLLLLLLQFGVDRSWEMASFKGMPLPYCSDSEIGVIFRIDFQLSLVRTRSEAIVHCPYPGLPVQDA